LVHYFYGGRRHITPMWRTFMKYLPLGRKADIFRLYSLQSSSLKDPQSNPQLVLGKRSHTLKFKTYDLFDNCLKKKKSKSKTTQMDSNLIWEKFVPFTLYSLRFRQIFFERHYSWFSARTTLYNTFFYFCLHEIEALTPKRINIKNSHGYVWELEIYR